MIRQKALFLICFLLLSAVGMAKSRYKDINYPTPNFDPKKTNLGTPDKPCGGSVDANPKTCCQTIHDCQKVVPLHYESEWQYKYV